MGMMATLAQCYSDNLSQGLYNGHVPFGMIKGDDGVPVADPATIEGLRLAFTLAGAGKSDREIARVLNAAGHRTHGYRTGKPELFTKDTVCALLQNRFYLGELPGAEPGATVPGQHTAVIDRATFDAARQERERRTVSRQVSVTRGATAHSLSGLGTCWHCGAKMHVQRSATSVRLCCANKRQGLPCASKSGTLERYEEQLGAHLATFTLPADYREKLRAYLPQEDRPAEDTTAHRQRIETRLARIKEMYSWGDLDRGAYLTERDLLQRDLAALDARESEDTAHLDRLAKYLCDVAHSWDRATNAQRNRIAGSLFEEVIVKDDQIALVKPRPELAGFFALDCSARGLSTEANRSPADIGGACIGAEVTGSSTRLHR